MNACSPGAYVAIVLITAIRRHLGHNRRFLRGHHQMQHKKIGTCPTEDDRKSCKRRRDRRGRPTERVMYGSKRESHKQKAGMLFWSLRRRRKGLGIEGDSAGVGSLPRGGPVKVG